MDLMAGNAHERCVGRDACMDIAETQMGACYVCVNAMGDASSAQQGDANEDVNMVT